MKLDHIRFYANTSSPVGYKAKPQKKCSKMVRKYLTENGFECELQETKISRQELSADIAVAEGYESFFSCTRTVKKGRIGYSGEILNHFVLLYFYQISVVDN